jgi:7-cyano-7-deazaguanine reductase
MDMNLNFSELGKKSAYETQYNPKLLFPIPRAIKRAELGINDANPGFYGVDIWTHYEISWLNTKGKPMVAIGELRYLASSTNIIESKSMKLYFNSFNNTKLKDADELINHVEKDISLAIGAPAKFTIIQLNETFDINLEKHAFCLDDLDIECDTYKPDSNLLFCENNETIKETVYSNLLKSNCLVTEQPDWGTVYIEYKGNQINHEGLLKYIISLRNHNEFHEQCVEEIFNDIKLRCCPKELTVYARYTRRGGLDINPYRTTNEKFEVNNKRLIRQ